MNKKVPNKIAAKTLGMSVDMMFWLMREGLIDVGTVITPKQSGQKYHKYFVYEDKLNKHIGKEVSGEEKNKEAV